MKAIIHVGSHKTATTAFQLLSHSCRDILRRHGIYYPQLRNSSSHNIIARDLRDWGQVNLDYLASCVRRAHQEGLNILLSAEDLEGTVSRKLDCKLLVELLRSSGYDISFIFVVRNPLSYLQSLYAEMAKHSDVILDLYSCAKTVSESKCLAVSSTQWCWDFVFDPYVFKSDFENVYSSTLSVVCFDYFLEGYPGRIVHKECASHSASEDLCISIEKIYNDTYKGNALNKRIDVHRVEILYACKALGVYPSQLKECTRTRDLCLRIADQRLRMNHIHEKEIIKLMQW